MIGYLTHDRDHIRIDGDERRILRRPDSPWLETQAAVNLRQHLTCFHGLSADPFDTLEELVLLHFEAHR